MAVAKWESCTWLSQLEEENYPSRPYSIHDGGGWSVHPQAQEFLISSSGRHPSTGSARRNQDGTQTLQYIHPSSFPSVSYVSGYRPKSVLARHAPYFLNSWIKIYTFNSRQQPTYQHSTFVSSSLPSLSSLFPFQIRKTRPQRLPPFFFLFRKAWLHSSFQSRRWANSSPSGRLIYSSWNVRYLVGVGTTYSAPSSRRVNICRKGTPPSPVRPYRPSYTKYWSLKSRRYSKSCKQLN